MKKFIALLIALTVSVSLLCACSNDNSDTQLKASSDNKSTSQNSLTESNVVDESDLFSFIIKLDGEKYTLPCNKSEFEDNGWSLSPQSVDHTPEKTMKPGDSAHYDLYKLDEETGKSIEWWDESYTIFAHNFTQSDAKLKDVPIYAFLFMTSHYENKGPELELPGGLVFKHTTTEDDIIAVYGEPQKIDPHKGVFENFITTDLSYDKREGDFIKSVHFTVVDQSEASSLAPVSVLFEYIYEPESEE